MKTNLFLLLVMAFVINACNVGVKKDLITGLKTSNNGLAFEEAYIMMDEAKITSAEFPLGKTVYLYTTGISGFTEKEGKVYPGASLSITDENGNKVDILDENGNAMPDNLDLLASIDQTGVTAEDAKVIFLHLKIDNPIKQGSKYIWKSKIWDKNGKGTIESELIFLVK